MMDTPTENSSTPGGADNQQSGTQKRKWYDSMPLMVGLLIIFFPVGLYALAKNTRLSGKAKVGVLAGWLVFMVVLMNSDDGQSGRGSAAPADATQREEAAQPAETAEQKRTRLYSEGRRTFADYQCCFPEFREGYETEKSDKGETVYVIKYGQKKNLEIRLFEKKGKVFEINMLIHLTTASPDGLSGPALLFNLADAMSSKDFEIDEINKWFFDNVKKKGASRRFGKADVLIKDVQMRPDGHWLVVTVF